MIGAVLQFADLQEICRPGKKIRRPTVEAWAKECGIRYGYDGDGGIWTTIEALNAALGIASSRADEPLRPEDVF